jgi:hypothetical protein
MNPKVNGRIGICTTLFSESDILTAEHCSLPDKNMHVHVTLNTSSAPDVQNAVELSSYFTGNTLPQEPKDRAVGPCFPIL